MHKIAARGTSEFELGYDPELGFWFAEYKGSGTSPVWSGECPSVIELIAATSGEIDWNKHPKVILDLLARHDRAFLRALRTVIQSVTA